MRPPRRREIEDRLARMERLQEELLEALSSISEQLGVKSQLNRRIARLERQNAAVLRHLALDPTALPYPERLLARRFGLTSQNDEDGITLALVDEMGQGSRRFAEIGCGANGGNCAVLAGELGWSGLMADARAAHVAKVRLAFGPRVTVQEAFVTRETIGALMAGAGLDGEIDVLSIDIDGNDLWIWETLGRGRARLVIAEYNSVFGPDRSSAVPYDPEFVRAREPRLRLYYGASLRAFEAMGRRLGYRLVGVEPRGANAFFLRDDVAPHVPAVDPAEAFRGAMRADYLPELDALVAERRLPLVDVA